MVFSLATLPCGVGLLFIYWFPHVTLKLIATKCSMTHATHVLLKVCTILQCINVMYLNNQFKTHVENSIVECY